MLRGLLDLTLLEIRIFLREPMGVVGTMVLPVFVFVVLGRSVGGGAPQGAAREFVALQLPVLAVLLIAIGAMTSLVTIVAIYRESGILKRLRATPLRPHTILSAHVVVKLMGSAATFALLVAAGKRYSPVPLSLPLAEFCLALLLITASVLALGFVLASIVPTARFAQPIGAAVVYPMIALCGLFTPVDHLPWALQVVANVLPLTYATSLLQGLLRGDRWWAHWADLAALAATVAVCLVVSARVFRWE